MSSKERIGIILDVDAEVSKAKVNISSLSKIFDGVGGSKGNQLRDLLSDISAEYEKLANESGKTMSKVGDFTKAEKSSERLSQLLRRLDKEVGNIGKSSKSDLSKFFPAEVADRVKKASDAVKTYNTILDNSSKKKGAIGAAADEYEKQERAARKAAEALKDLQDIQNGNSKKQAVTSDVKVKKQESLTAANADVKKYSAELEAAQKAMDEFKVRKADLFAKGTQNKSSEFRTLRDDLAAAENNFKTATDKAADLRRELKNMVVVGDLDAQIEEAEQALKDAQAAADQLKQNLDKVTASEFSRAFDEAKKKLEGMSGIDLSKITNIDDLNNLLQRFTNEGIKGLEDGLRKAGVEINELGDANSEVRGKIQNVTADVEAQNRAMEDVNGIKNRILQFFSLTNAMQLGRQAIRETIETVKELDKSMTETAVVTDFSVGDMWDQLPEYTDMARQYGVAIKGVYDASTLYYQQGLNQQQTMQLTGETLKMARIAGLEYAEATDLMTAALRGFNMELNETNATRINDVYSELAAITAADTEEIATAMTKTASIASSANMEFETTAALLSQIIETTREPAETAGTAMKTIIARFTEMKKATSDLITVDGEEVSVNKVETALKSAGVALRDVNGEFRDLDDVFLELSSKWNSLDIMTQRYIATTAAGSRQQSRFIAMMQNYDRTMELVNAAYDSAGSSTKQFGKTQESLETKIANLEAAWQEFLMGISNSDAIKGIIDLLTGLLNALNNATTGVDGFSTFALRMFSLMATFKIGKSVFNKIFANINTEMLKGGVEGGRQLSQGIRQGTQQSIGQAIKGLAKSVPKKIRSIFQTSTMIPNIPINFDWNNGSMGMKDFAKTITASMSTAEIASSMPDIGTTLENSVIASLKAHGLNDDGVAWAKTLIEGFRQRMQQEGAVLQTEVENLENDIKAALEDPDNSKNFGDKDANDNTRKTMMQNASEDFSQNGGKVFEEAIPATEKLEANIMGIGTALTSASMAANLVTSALQESGAISEDTAKAISSLSNGLSTAGTLMMVLKTASDAFNISAAANPYLMAAAVIIGVITTIASLLGQAAEKQKEFNEAATTKAKESAEEVQEIEDLNSSYEELLNTYKKTGEESEELISAKQEIIDWLKEEGYEADNLAMSYEDVAKAANDALLEIKKKDLYLQKSGQKGAVDNLVREGGKSGDTGYNSGGASFSINLSKSDSFAALQNIMTDIAESKGITGLTFGNGGFDGYDMDISGYGTSAQDQAMFAQVLMETMTQYQQYLTDNGLSADNSAAYQNMLTWFSKVETYLTDIDETQSQAESDAAALMQNDVKNLQFRDFADFSNKIDDLVTKYAEAFEGVLTEDEIRSVLLDTTAKSSDQVTSYYANALDKLESISDQDGYADIVKALDLTTAKIISQMKIDKNTSAQEVQQQMAAGQLLDALSGDKDFIETIASYSDKINKGEFNEDDFIAVASMLNDTVANFNNMTERQLWESTEGKGRAAQLAALTDISEARYDEAKANRAKVKVATGLTVFDTTQAEYTTYTQKKSKADAGKKYIDEQSLGKYYSGTLPEGGVYKKYHTDNAEAKGIYDAAVAYEPQDKTTDEQNVQAVQDSQDFISNGNQDKLIKNPKTGFGEFINDLWDDIVYATNVQGQVYAGAANTVDYATQDSREAEDQEQEDIKNGVTKVPGKDITYQEAASQYEDFDKATVPEGQNKETYINEQFQNRADFENTYGVRDENGKLQYDEQGNVILSTEGQLLDAGVYGLADNHSKYSDEEYNKLDDATKFSFVQQNVRDYKNTMAAMGAAHESNSLGIDDNSTKTWDQIKKDLGDSADTADMDRYLRMLSDAGKIDLTKPWKEVKKQVDDIKEEGKDAFEIEADLDSDNVDKKLDAIAEAEKDVEELTIQVALVGAEAALALLDQIQAEAQNASSAAGMIGSDYQVDTDTYKQLMEMYPELLENARVAAGGMIQLDRSVVDNAIQGKKEELTATMNKTKAERELAINNLKTRISTLEKIRDGTEKAENATALIEVSIHNKKAQDEVELAEQSANGAITASNSATTAVGSNISKLSKQIHEFGLQINQVNAALRGDTYGGSIVGNVTGAEELYEYEGDFKTSEDISARYTDAQSGLQAYKAYRDGLKEGEEGKSAAEFMKEYYTTGAGADKNRDAADTQQLINSATFIYDTVSAQIEADKAALSDLENGHTDILTEAEIAKLLTPAQRKALEDSKNGGKTEKEKENAEKLTALQKELNELKEKEAEIDSAIKDLTDNEVVDMARVNDLLEQKLAVQKKYLAKLREEAGVRAENENARLSELNKKGYGKYVQKNEETGLYELTERFYNEMYVNGKAKDAEKANEVLEYLEGLNQVTGESLQTQLEIERLVEEMNGGSAETYNAERTVKGAERRQSVADREEQLIGRLPEEIQGPLKVMNTAEDAWIKYDEMNANRLLLEKQQRDFDITYAGVPQHIKDALDYDEFNGWTVDTDHIRGNYTGDELKEMMSQTEENAKILNEKADSMYELQEKLDGGKIQDAIYGMAKASKTASKAFKDQDKATDHLNDAFNDLEDRLGLSDDALDKFADAIGGAIESSEFLSEEIEGIGLENAKQKIENSPLAGLMSEEQKTELTNLLGNGGTRGDILGTIFGGGSDILNGIGDLASFDMMEIGFDMFENVKGMIDQGKQMIEKIIGYITQATQVIVDAWTNREDYLYNFLKIIEKHLSEYEKLQRYSTQLEKGRLSSSQDILNNWNEQWKSLQLQLEEQTERLEARQQELDRSRWNPFSLISGWDPTSDTLYENREVKFIWDVIIGLGEAFAPFGTGAFFSQLNQLYEDYDKRVQQSYEDRLAAEQALLDIEDERLELVKVGADEATEFEQKLLDAMIQKEQEQIDELTRLNDAITDANSKLISTLQDNLDKMRQDRENEKKEEQLGEKERRLAYLRQDTSGANMMEIKTLEEQLEEEHEDYTDTLIDQKISELEKQNELAAEQRQQQIDLLQGQLDYAEKYGLYWDAIYGMLYTIDENGNAVLNPENFDLDGNIRENSELAKMLGTFSDRLGMSVWSSVLDNEETKRLGRYYGAFIGMNGVDGNWANYWALKDPGANDPNYAYPEQEIPDGLWGVLYKLEIGIKKYFGNSNLGLVNGAERVEVGFKNFFGKLFGIEEWANAKAQGFNPAHVDPSFFSGLKQGVDDLTAATTQGWENFKGLFASKSTNNTRAADMGRATTEKAKSNMNNYGTQNYGAVTENYNFNIGTVGENISLDDMVDRVSSAIRGLFTSDGVGGLQKKR